MTRSDIIAAIEQYAKDANLAPSSVCQYALKNGKLYANLKRGGGCHIDTPKRLMDWMQDNPPSSFAPTEAGLSE